MLSPPPAALRWRREMGERDPIGLYVSDGEIAALLGIGETKGNYIFDSPIIPG